MSSQENNSGETERRLVRKMLMTIMTEKLKKTMKKVKKEVTKRAKIQRKEKKIQGVRI